MKEGGLILSLHTLRRSFANVFHSCNDWFNSNSFKQILEQCIDCFEPRQITWYITCWQQYWIDQAPNTNRLTVVSIAIKLIHRMERLSHRNQKCISPASLKPGFRWLGSSTAWKRLRLALGRAPHKLEVGSHPQPPPRGVKRGSSQTQGWQDETAETRSASQFSFWLALG